MNTTMLMAGTALVLGTMFTSAAMAEDVKAHPETCYVHNGQGYKWSSNIDKDASGYDKDIADGKAVKGPVMSNRNLNRTTEIGVTGLYLRDASCDPKPKL